MKINQISEQFSLSIDTLRYYEKIGLLNHVDRDNGIRNYKEKDVERLQFIQCMKKSGMTLESIRQYFDYLDDFETTFQERLDMLEKQYAIALKQKQELQESIDYLEYKMKLTRTKMKESEKAHEKD